MQYLPPGSAVWCLDHGVDFGTDPTNVLLADVYYALTGTPHPMAVKPSKAAAVARHENLAARLREHRARTAKRKEGNP